MKPWNYDCRQAVPQSGLYQPEKPPKEEKTTSKPKCGIIEYRHLKNQQRGRIRQSMSSQRRKFANWRRKNFPVQLAWVSLSAKRGKIKSERRKNGHCAKSDK
jgi:hypothetical protein